MIEIDIIMDLLTSKRNKRTTNLVAEVTFDDEGKISTENWAYPIGYAFRDALDIKYTERIKDNKKHMLWTQGGYLSFKEGDYITSKDKSTNLHVKFAQKIGWDADNDCIYLGVVVFDVYESNNKVNRFECNQVDFFGFLISGIKQNFKPLIF